jgi:ATPase involved in DNA repair
MRLKQIALENFRCFRLANIDLSADIVAIYGRNGVGKTAIFDAIQFALLGSIGRFADEPTPPDYLPHVFSDDKAVVHIDFKDDTDSWVKLTIDRMSNLVVSS